MRTKILQSLLCAALFFQSTATIAQQSQKERTNKKTVVLFDGTSTNAWKDIKSDVFPEQGWVEYDGVLTVLPKTDKQEGGHDIITKEQFSNFELELKFV